MASLRLGIAGRGKGARRCFGATSASEQSRTALVPCFEAYFSQYTAVANVVVDRWMQELSGSEFKVLLLFIRDTIGQESKRAAQCLESELTIDQIGKRTGLNRESVIIAVRGLEATGHGLIVAQRKHRATTRYSLNLGAVLGPRVGKSDPVLARVGKSDPCAGFGSENPMQAVGVESENPTLKRGFGSENPTPYKEIKKAAAAAASSGAAAPCLNAASILAADWIELRSIEEHAAVRIDGKNAQTLKRRVEAAGLTLAHFRWFVQRESFSGARSRLAVLLALARDFSERAVGIEWPECLEPPANRGSRGFSASEISELR